MKNAGLLLAALCLLLLVAPDSFAETITLDFESLRREDASLHIWGPTVSEDGFTLTASHFEPGNPHRFNTVGTGHYLYPDSTAVFQGVSQGDILLTRDGLLPFDLISMDLSVLPSAQPDGITPIFLGAFDVTLYGDRMDGGVVSQTLRLDGVLSLQTFSLDAFSNLRAVRWRRRLRVCEELERSYPEAADHDDRANQ